MPIPEGFQKAKLVHDGGEIECAFNPTSFSVTKTNVWTFKPVTGTDLPDGTFGGGLPRVTKISLLLDESLGDPKETVTKQSNDLLKMMETGGGGGGGGGAPPKIAFKWGSVELPKSFPVSITVQYVLFKPNGEPIRANVELELAQAEKASTASGSPSNAGTNPGTRSPRGMRSHRVKDGDSLPSISYDNYGDATLWREIAEVNGIDDPMRLRRGTELIIPALEG